MSGWNDFNEVFVSLIKSEVVKKDQEFFYEIIELLEELSKKHHEDLGLDWFDKKMTFDEKEASLSSKEFSSDAEELFQKIQIKIKQQGVL